MFVSFIWNRLKRAGGVFPSAEATIHAAGSSGIMLSITRFCEFSSAKARPYSFRGHDASQIIRYNGISYNAIVALDVSVLIRFYWRCSRNGRPDDDPRRP
jgi:hypothetical protein